MRMIAYSDAAFMEQVFDIENQKTFADQSRQTVGGEAGFGVRHVGLLRSNGALALIFDERCQAGDLVVQPAPGFVEILGHPVDLAAAVLISDFIDPFDQGPPDAAAAQIGRGVQIDQITTRFGLV